MKRKGINIGYFYAIAVGVTLSGVCTILASICLTLAIRHIGSVHTSILGAIEPIVCAIAGFFVLGEAISLKSGIGIAVVLIATVLVTLSKQKTSDKRRKQYE